MAADLTLDPPPGERSARSMAVEQSLSRLTDPMTFRRAKLYARDGAVLDFGFLDGRVRVKGRVRGSRGNVYACVVKFSQAPSGTVSAVSGACSCPVVSNCKHAYAVLLTAFDDAGFAGGVRQADSPATPIVASWKRALSPLLRDERPGSAAEHTRLGLQIELIRLPHPVSGPPSRGRSAPGAGRCAAGTAGRARKLDPHRNLLGPTGRLRPSAAAAARGTGPTAPRDQLPRRGFQARPPLRVR